MENGTIAVKPEGSEEFVPLGEVTSLSITSGENKSNVQGEHKSILLVDAPVGYKAAIPEGVGKQMLDQAIACDMLDRKLRGSRLKLFNVIQMAKKVLGIPSTQPWDISPDGKFFVRLADSADYAPQNMQVTTEEQSVAQSANPEVPGTAVVAEPPTTNNDDEDDLA